MHATQRAVISHLAFQRVLGVAERDGLIRQPPRGSKAARWHVYEHGYLARIVDALQLEYPALVRIVGEGPFRALIRRYLARCVPRSFDLGHAGDRLAEFLRDDELTGALPFLPDLARAERHLAEAFVAADAEPVTWSALCRLEPARVLELGVRARPRTALFRSAWTIADLWRLRDEPDDAVGVELVGRGQIVLIHRVGFAVRLTTVGALEAVLVDRALAAETSLADAYEHTAEGVDEASDVTDWIAAFRSLVELEVFTPTAARSSEAERRFEEDVR